MILDKIQYFDDEYFLIPFSGGNDPQYFATYAKYIYLDDDGCIIFYSKLIWGRWVCHRLDGPAQIYPNGTYAWFFKGHGHRLNGPALYSETDGQITPKWFYLGECVTDTHGVNSQEQFENFLMLL